jgi:hypothetical protein
VPVLFWLCCSSCHVLAVLFRPYCPGVHSLQYIYLFIYRRKTAKVQAQKQGEKVRARKIRNGGAGGGRESAKANAQHLKFKKSVRAQAQERSVLPGSAKAQEGRPKKACAQLCHLVPRSTSLVQGEHPTCLVQKCTSCHHSCQRNILSVKSLGIPA